MGVKLVSASGGSVEIAAPATVSNYTATLPAVTGTVVVENSSGIPTLTTPMVYMPQTIGSTITTPDNTNVLSAGPITIATGQAVTVGTGGYWTIV